MGTPWNEPSEHVLFLIDRFPQKMGGAEGTLLKMTRLLEGTRYRCSVMTFAIDPLFKDIRELFRCPLHVVPLRRTYDWNALRVAMRLARLIRSERVSIVHTFFPTSDLWGGIIAKLSGCPVLVSSRRDMGLGHSPKHRLAYRLLHDMFDQVQAVSDEVRRYALSADGLAPNRVVTLHNGVDLDEVRDIAPLSRSCPTLGARSASHLIVTVGNIRWVKGTDILIKAAARVHQTFPNALFVIVGRANEEDYFREVRGLARSLGVEAHVRFLGLREDVISILKASDVFFLPSRSEGMSNALLEAMACQLPCVVTRVGGNREVVQNGKSGFLVPPENPERAAECITGLLCDPAQAREMGLAGRKIVEAKFTAQVMLDRLIRHYDSLLAEKSPAIRPTRIEKSLAKGMAKRIEPQPDAAAPLPSGSVKLRQASLGEGGSL